MGWLLEESGARARWESTAGNCSMMTRQKRIVSPGPNMQTQTPGGPRGEHKNRPRAHKAARRTGTPNRPGYSCGAIANKANSRDIINVGRCTRWVHLGGRRGTRRAKDGASPAAAGNVSTRHLKPRSIGSIELTLNALYPSREPARVLPEWLHSLLRENSYTDAAND